MLGKLIKYDLKAMGKTIIPFWAALLISGWLLAIQNQFSSIGKFSTMNVIVVLICIVVITAVLVMNVVIIIQRFWNGLLKEEGYLMFTLPVSSRGLIFSKLISAMLISLGTGIVIILMFLPWIFLEEVHFEDIRTIMNAINLSIVKWSVIWYRSLYCRGCKWNLSYICSDGNWTVK